MNEIRARIDEIDGQIKELFLARMDCARLVAQTKAERGGDVFVPQREAEIIQGRTADVDGAFRARYADFLTGLMRISRNYQYSLLTGMQAEVGSAGAGGAVCRAGPHRRPGGLPLPRRRPERLPAHGQPERHRRQASGGRPAGGRTAGGAHPGGEPGDGGHGLPALPAWKGSAGL